jgi:ribosomal protein S25
MSNGPVDPPTEGGRPPVQGKRPEHVKAMEVEAHRDLRLLEAVHEDSLVTQRGLASKLGIALGLANIYLKRMIHKGYIKCVNVQPNRISYLITPRGIAEKARLTYEFMDYSLHLYGEVRQHLREAMQDCAAAGKRVAIYGSGEAAELAYLSLKESGMDPVAIFDHDGGRVFLGMPVLPIAEHASVEYDLMIVATLDRTGQPSVDLLKIGVPGNKLFPLRKAPEPAPKSAAARSTSDKRARTTPVRSRSTNGKHS